MERWELSVRKPTTSAAASAADWETAQQFHLARGAQLIKTYNIVRDLVILADETAQLFMPGTNGTVAPTGAKHIAVRNNDDKRQLTVMLGVVMTDKHPPPKQQMIFQGKTAHVHPKMSDEMQRELIFSHSENHWANEHTTLEYLQEITFWRLRVGYAATDWVLLVWDVYYAHRHPDVLKFARENRIALLFVPANTTSRLQLCDVGINKPFKSRTTKSFQAWAAASYKDMPDDFVFKPTLSELRREVASWVCRAAI